jgi:phospholipid-binding lipoprotein MlaA
MSINVIDRIFTGAFKTNAMRVVASRAILVFASGVLLALTGCATGPNANPRDPLEPYNRAMSSFNDGVDRAVLKPVATAYVAITPSLVRQGVTNFFGNLQDGWTFVNSVLQLRPQKAVESITRFSMNTFFGLGGLLDVAGEAGVPKHNEDLGKTLGRWGVPSGPYLVLPILGPSTIRDALTITAETAYDPVSQINPIAARNTVTVVRLVNSRSKFLRLGNLLDDAALDKYSFTRDAFLAKRNADVARSADKEVDDTQEVDKDDSKDDKPEVEPKK